MVPAARACVQLIGNVVPVRVPDPAGRGVVRGRRTAPRRST